MKINKENYEAFFLDFVEGRLDNSSTLELLAFLRKYPHLKAELESFEDIKLPAEEEIFEDKDFLKKLDFANTSVNEYNVDDYSIAYQEKILTKPESEKLFAYLDKHPEQKKSFQLFGKAILKADPEIVFKGKSALYRKSKGVAVRTVILRWTAVAAGVAILISVFYKSGTRNYLTQAIEKTVAKTEYSLPETKNTTTEEVQNEVKKSFVKANYSKKEIEEAVQESERVVASNNSTYSKDSLEFNQSIEKIDPINNVQIPTSNEPLTLAISDNKVVKNPDVSEQSKLDLAKDKLIEKVFKKTDILPKRKITLWDVAQATIKGYNSISESDVRLSKKTDKDGKLKALAFETENRTYGFNTGKE
jgi:hypothetical protein